MNDNRPLMRLDLALIRAHPGLSRRKARDVIEKGQVSVDGATVREAGRAFHERSTLKWDPNRKALSKHRISLPVLHQDDDLVIVDKPAGLLSVPTSDDAGNEDTVLARLQEFARKAHPHRPYVGVVHRLDRGTSGSLVFAWNPVARTALRSLLRARRVERRYWAIVHGVPKADEGVVDRPIRDAYISGRKAVAKDDMPARDALTRWRVIERLRQAALVEVALGTGRQHQIRIHMAFIKHPIVGDSVYGSGAPTLPGVKAGRPLLHARTLGFSHPTTGHPISVQSPVPADFASALRALRRGR